MDETSTHNEPSPPKWRYLLPAAAAMAVVAAALYWFPPDRHGFYPRCLLKTMTGWQCPGCGGLRAAHHVLHGRIGEALQLNPFLMVAGLWGATLGMVEIYRWRKPGARDNPLRRVWVLWTMTILMVVYGIARNLPL